MTSTLISTTQAPATTLSTDNTVRRADAAATASVLSTGSTSGTALSTGDQASVSSAAGTIQKHLGGSDVRADKVAALQQAIAGGTYNVSAGDVAEKILSGLLGE